MTTGLTVKQDRALTESAESITAEWLEFERAEGASRLTLIAYRKGLAVFEAWRAGEVGTVTPQTVREFKADLASRYSVQTVNLRLSALRSFYRFMVNTDRLPYNPASQVKGVKRHKSKMHKRDRLADGEIMAVLDTCNTGTLAGVRDKAILSLCSYCGLRAIEVRRADIGNLVTQGDRLVLWVWGKGRKEADEFVVVPFHQEPVIRAWLAHRSTFADHTDADPLFISLSNRSRGGRLATRSIRAMVKARYAKAGVVGSKKTTHSLRHSAITNVIRHGGTPMQTQTFARHASYDTTLGYYHEAARLDNPAEDLISYAG